MVLKFMHLLPIMMFNDPVFFILCTGVLSSRGPAVLSLRGPIMI